MAQQQRVGAMGVKGTHSSDACQTVFSKRGDTRTLAKVAADGSRALLNCSRRLDNALIGGP